MSYRHVEPESLVSKDRRPRHCGYPMENAGAGIWECLNCHRHAEISPRDLPRLAGQDLERFTA